MPAKKKSIGEHKLQGTYQKCRHQQRAEKATATGERVVPDWLPANAKAVYAELMQDLPPLNSTDAITLSQVAILKAELMESPENFATSKHSQLRSLCITVKGWIDDYQSMKPASKEDNPWLELVKPTKPKLGNLEQWMAEREPRDDYERYQVKKAQRVLEAEAMTPEERAERQQKLVASLTRGT